MIHENTIIVGMIEQDILQRYLKENIMLKKLNSSIMTAADLK